MKLMICFLSGSTLFKYNINMEDFEIGAVEIDSELIGQDLDDIDPYAEFTEVEDDEYQTDILFE